MPKEFRRITFSGTDLRDALKSQDIDVPSGEITSISSVSREQAFHYELNIYRADKRETVTADLSEDDAQEALIKHCIALKIPLPREAAKSVRVIGDKLCLDLHLL